MRKNQHIGSSSRWIWPLLFALIILSLLSGVAGATVYYPAQPFAALSAPSVTTTPAPYEQQYKSQDMTVYVDCASGFYELEMQQGNVGAALSSLGLKYDEDDRVTPGLHVLLEDGIRIEATSVETRTRTETEVIEHKTKKNKTDSLEKGKTEISQKGEDGSETLVYEDTYIDGELTDSELIKKEVTKEAVTEVVLVGTKVVDPVVSVSAEISLRNDNRKDRDPPKESEVEKVVYVQATAYTHTGHKTATGVVPYVGMIAVNPKQIPYGTRLYVEGYGYGVAGDTGGFRHTSRFQIDLFMDTYDECMDWGRKNDVKVYILD